MISPVVAAVLTVVGLGSLVFGFSEFYVKRSLRELELTTTPASANDHPTLAPDTPFALRVLAAFSYRLYGEVSFFKALAQRSMSANAANERLLAQAGRPYGLTAEMLTIMSTLAPIGCGAAGAIVALLLGIPWFLGVAFGIGLGLYPRVYVVRLARNRAAKIRRGLPGMLDLIVMTAAAGVTRETGIVLVSQEVGGPLGEEMSVMAEQIRANVDALEVFRQLAERTQVEEVENFVQALTTATLYSSMTYQDIIEQQSTRLRTDLAQETATKVRGMVVKILLPLVVFYLPSIMLILLGPALGHLHSAGI